MPPRRNKAAVDDERCPKLKLKIVKGPLSGQNFEFLPKSRLVVRIGREGRTRGNIIAINDAGISTKHLSIQPESFCGRWIVIDVGSSNGTVLNGVELRPNLADELSHGDEIKIGEETSIMVEFGDDVGSAVKDSNAVSTRRTRSSRKAGSTIEDPIDLSVIESGKPRGRKKKVVEAIPEETEKVAEELNATKEDVELRPNLSDELSHGDEIKIGEEMSIMVEFGDDVVGSAVKDSNTVSTRRTRSSEGSTIEDPIDLSVIESGKPRGRKKKVVEAIPEESEKVAEELNATKEDVDLGVSTRRTRSSRNVVESAIDVSSIEGRKTRGRKKKVVETIPEDDACGSSRSGVKQNTGKEGDAVEAASDVVETIPEEIDATKDNGACGSGVKKNVETGKGKMVADLETMTMGEWLDFLEVYLPQKIIEETEAEIAEMRRMAERYHEYTVQQKKLMGKK